MTSKIIKLVNFSSCHFLLSNYGVKQPKYLYLPSRIQQYCYMFSRKLSFHNHHERISGGVNLHADMETDSDALLQLHSVNLRYSTRLGKFILQHKSNVRHETTAPKHCGQMLLRNAYQKLDYVRVIQQTPIFLDFLHRLLLRVTRD